MIAAGHLPAAIGQYTERQLMLYFDAAQRQIRRQRANQLVDISHAFTGGKDAKTHLRDLQKD